MDDPSNESARRRRLPVRAVSAAVLAILLGGTLGATITARRILDDQERRLLKTRAAELNVVLTTALSPISTGLGTLGTVARVSGANSGEFNAAASRTMATSPNYRAVALLQVQADGSVVVAAAVGPGLNTGQTVTGARAAVAKRALTAKNLVTTPIFRDGNEDRLAFALGPPATPDGLVAYQESTVQRQSPPVTSTAPFAELDVAIFTAPTYKDSQLLLTSGGAPSRFHHPMVKQKFPVGADAWYLLVAPRRALVGSLANRVPWLVGLLGVVGSFLVFGTVELVLRRRDYALALVDERTAALRDSLTQLSEAQSQLVRNERLAAVGQLASAVGHELRNPLGVITNTLYLIRSDTEASTDERLNRHINTAEREVAAATLIVSDLLDFARAREPILAAVDLPDLIGESLEVAPHPEAIQVSWQAPSDLPPVNGDRDLLRQVLLNLITNAYDAMPAGGELKLETKKIGTAVQTTVADNGEGIGPDARSHLFEPFFTTKARGVGLGLAVTERIVTAHHGQITVDSTPGRGTTFTITLPVHQNGGAS